MCVLFFQLTIARFSFLSVQDSYVYSSLQHPFPGSDDNITPVLVRNLFSVLFTYVSSSFSC